VAAWAKARALAFASCSEVGTAVGVNIVFFRLVVDRSMSPIGGTAPAVGFCWLGSAANQEIAHSNREIQPHSNREIQCILYDSSPHHISGWGVVVVLLSYCLSRPPIYYQHTCTIYRDGARHPLHLNARVGVLLLLK